MNKPIPYDFTERVLMSHGVSANRNIRDILLERIPGSVNAHPAHITNDRNGTDYWVEHMSGKHLSVDCKIREEDYFKKQGCDDLALEIWSVKETGKVGWTRDTSKRTDFILWYWNDTGRYCFVPFPELCNAMQTKWQEWARRYKTAEQRSWDNGRTWTSECVFVPRREVHVEMYRQNSGDPKIGPVRVTAPYGTLSGPSMAP
jgi:hypothetical protein